MKHIGIVGGGASGIVAAIQAKRYLNDKNINCDVTIYESLNRIGKKILATGNGKCNLLNESTDSTSYNGDKAYIDYVFGKFSRDSNINFFASLGLMTYTENAGRIYPLSNQAASVLDAFRFEIEKLKINVITGCKITSVSRQCKGFLLNNKHYADAVIFAGGGFSSPVQGSDGSCIKLLEKTGLKINECVPALTPIVVKSFSKSLKGIRADATIEIIHNNSVIAYSKGEIQFTEYGFSGIPAMDVSYAVSRLLIKNEKVGAVITLCENLSAEDIKNYLFTRKKENPVLSCENVITGILNKNLGIYKLKQCDIPPTEQIGNISSKKLSELAEKIKKQQFEIDNVKDFTFSQVTSGGCILSQFTKNLEFTKINGIFVCGEALDVDAKCGGYNLQWAFSSGRLAGEASAKYIIGEKQC